jgi:hypothetical protein
MPALRKIEKPQPGEYAAYASMYVDLTPDDGPILIFLERNAEILANLYRSLPEERLLYRYAPGKWTMKEILNHLIDDERIYALCVSRATIAPSCRDSTRTSTQENRRPTGAK